MRLRKMALLAGLLTGALLPVTIVCDVPRFVHVVDPLFVEEEVIFLDGPLCCGWFWW